MLDHTIMTRIMERLRQRYQYVMAVCDLSGRVIASSDSSMIGTLSLPAIQCLNINSATSFSSDNRTTDGNAAEAGTADSAAGSSQNMLGFAVPLRHAGSRIGAVVIYADSCTIKMAEFMGTGIEMMYEEMLGVQNFGSIAKERSQFLLELLYKDPPYSEDFIERGRELRLDILSPYTVVVADMQKGEDQALMITMIRGLMGEYDTAQVQSDGTLLILLYEGDHDQFVRRRERVNAVLSKAVVGLAGGQTVISEGFRLARDCLRLGSRLNPEQHIHRYDDMKLLIALARLDKTELSRDYRLLLKHGSSARLAETFTSYIKCDGDIKKLCEMLHIHRNSIPYRLRRIKEVCGRDITKIQDLLMLYASYIAYEAENDLKQ